MSAFLGGGSKKMPNLPTDSSKKLRTGGGRGEKFDKFADVINGWSLCSAALNKITVSLF